mgnify:CR=1 FL=1
MKERIWHGSYDEGVEAEIDFQDVSIAGWLSRSARLHADRPAVAFMNCRMTYSQLDQQVDRLATALAGMGVGKGTSVAIHLPNLPQTVISFFAVQRLGARAVMTNPLYVPREIEHQFKDADVEVAITADFLWERHLRGMRKDLPVREYIVASIPEYLRFPLNLLAPLKLKRMDPPSIAKVEASDGVHLFRKLLDGTQPSPPEVEHSMDDVACIQYTGGTTGVSKGENLRVRKGKRQRGKENTCLFISGYVKTIDSESLQLRIGLEPAQAEALISFGSSEGAVLSSLLTQTLRSLSGDAEGVKNLDDDQLRLVFSETALFDQHEAPPGKMNINTKIETREIVSGMKIITLPPFTSELIIGIEYSVFVGIYPKEEEFLFFNEHRKEVEKRIKFNTK